MGADFLKIFKLPIILFGWLIKSFLTIFITLIVIIGFLITKKDIAEIIENSFSEYSSGNSPIPTQQLITTPQKIEYLLHTYEYGDTIQKLAKRYHVPFNTIVALNCIDRNNPLYYGKILYIPQYSKDFSSVPRKENKKTAIIFL
jgi:LysM repeat protein